MNKHLSIGPYLALLTSILITGCVKKSEYDRVVAQLEHTRAELKESASETEINSEMTSATIKKNLEAIQNLEKQIDQLKKESDRKDKYDTYEFAAANEVFNSNNILAARDAFNKFIQNFPTSSLLPKAQERFNTCQKILLIGESRQKAPDDVSSSLSYSTANNTSKDKSGLSIEAKTLIDSLQTNAPLTELQLHCLFSYGTLNKYQIKRLLGPPSQVESTPAGDWWVWYDRAISSATEKIDMLTIGLQGDGMVNWWRVGDEARKFKEESLCYPHDDIDKKTYESIISAFPYLKN